MELSIYQVDAFASEVFRGNPAAVVPLTSWLDDAVMQAIAAENNLSETAFFVTGDDELSLRWFTPAVEVDLCGHATLASAYVVFEELRSRKGEVRFVTPGGLTLGVTQKGELLELDFPARKAERVALEPALAEAMGATAQEQHSTPRDILLVYETQAQVAALDPDMRALRQHGGYVIATAPGDDVDFVSRFFAPAGGIDEDPVTGSAHCVLVPFWAGRLNKRELHARQISKRGGELWCQAHGDRVAIAGRAVLYLRGTIQI